MTVAKVIELQERVTALRKHKDRENALINLLDKFEQGENLRLVVKKGADEYALEANESDAEASAIRSFLVSVWNIEKVRVMTAKHNVQDAVGTLEVEE